MQVYNGEFTNWDDVAREYASDGNYYGKDVTEAEKQRLKNLIDIPEPEKVIWAGYHTGSYDGDSTVCYFDKGKYYLVKGGHCSCYGLEGLWEPEEYENKELLIACIDKGNSDYKNEIIANIKESI